MLRFFSTLEKVTIGFLILIILGTSYYLYNRYIEDHSELIPDSGGIYTEGVLGRPQFLNPTLLLGNPVDRDLSQLIFSGLTRYNPHTGLIEDDLATSEKSKDNLSYTFTILPDAKWHDGEAVTADDVLFTYKKVLQNKAFLNSALRQVFADVSIEKLSPYKVRFRLPSPYSFFLSNVTMGLLPKHLLDRVPVENLDKSDFNQNPVGTGPYQFVSWIFLNDTHEITLRRFEGYYAQIPKIQTILVRAFPDEASLLLAENTLTAYRVSTPPADLSSAGRFELLSYRLPQYSALFLNTESDILSNKKVRFALLLATNKQDISRLLPDAEVVDTPILESKEDLDIEYSLERSMGAFFDTEWHLPGKKKNEEKPKKIAFFSESDGFGGPISDTEDLNFVLLGKEDSWIALETDGTVKPSFLLKAGEQKTFTVKKSLIFKTIGNAGGLTISVNGLALKPLGKTGEVLRGLKLDRTTLEKYLAQVQPEKVEQPPEEVKIDKPAEEVPSDFVPPEDAELSEIRINNQGKRLILRLITAQEPSVFLQVAEIVQKQWLKAGVKVVIETYSFADLQGKIQQRDYDLLLFGQNLGYNLDAFPFWHSSQAQSGLNLSEYRSLEADNLLVDIRKTFDERTKQVLIEKLKKVIAEDTPAIFLSNPIHYYAVDRSVKRGELGKMSNHEDRLQDVLTWYLKEEYRLKEPFSISSLIRWIFTW